MQSVQLGSLEDPSSLDRACGPEREVSRRGFFAIAASALLAACGDGKQIATDRPQLPPEQINELVSKVKGAVEKLGDHVFQSIPKNPTQLVVVVRHVHAPPGDGYPDPSGEGQRLLEMFTDSATASTGAVLAAMHKRELYVDGIVGKTHLWFKAFESLDDKRRDPESIKAEIKGFEDLKAAVSARTGFGKEEALAEIDTSIAEWSSLLFGVEEFHRYAKISPAHRLTIAKLASVQSSEDADLFQRTFEVITQPEGQKSDPANSDDLLTSLRKAAKLSGKDELDDLALWNDPELAKLQNAREDHVLRLALSAGPTAVILMGAGHRFADNLQRLGIADSVALIEVHPKFVWEQSQ